MNQKTLCILGSTGSIGTQALEVCQAHNFPVCGLAAYHNVNLLAEQAKRFRPKKVCIFCKEKYGELKALLGDDSIEVVTGMEGLLELSVMPEADMVLNSVVGMIGLRPTLAAIEAKKEIALANKETLVTGGKLVIEAARKNNVPIYPVDSEHSAIFQSLQGNEHNRIHKILLTASGGPFYGRTAEELRNVTVEDALKHPNWSMGAKITIDSATLMNKGLEFIEAMWLFDLKPEQIEVIVHRESVIHSAVEYEDHSVIAQLGVPDMKIPIQYALTYPNRIDCPVKPLSLTDYGALSFSKPDYDTFVCLKACIKAITMGGLMPAAVNGANEQAVDLFLKGQITFLKIGELVYETLDAIPNQNNFTVDDIINTDKAARRFVLEKAGMLA
ncbi:1-deoxy-D-xylulose 5-phosphate reductoisomerase [uncultured Ruminococcus sp.]|uniref:1-deoxy-D-xylulose-5-phosphate reductoisomerase n=1 Tax=Massiliimalia timonensis TaxID=1987501 RepID=UPI000821AB8A|nr:1-deoxy-D-xylulose-5-phosphate reductoisomerase [Massiliimalia timonensis]SCH01646.1 1-deoxy-D-xylulose 5-phosphate reductoisomerase [uncultured Ruminococcus sp.]SCH72146.1 1-deoxy-D-xylulose 5-phosphate reductoisomerase [uncultured Clostridium sp.]